MRSPAVACDRLQPPTGSASPNAQKPKSVKGDWLAAPPARDSLPTAASDSAWSPLARPLIRIAGSACSPSPPIQLQHLQPCTTPVPALWAVGASLMALGCRKSQDTYKHAAPYHVSGHTSTLQHFRCDRIASRTSPDTRPRRTTMDRIDPKRPLLVCLSVPYRSSELSPKCANTDIQILLNTIGFL